MESEATPSFNADEFQPFLALQEAVYQLLEEAAKGRFQNLSVREQPELQLISPWDAKHVSPELKHRALSLADDFVSKGGVAGASLARAMGAMVGMAVADGLGHHLEFVAVRDAPRPGMPYIEYPCSGGESSDPRGRVHDGFNRFGLKAGQWTDDASMGLCMADSLLVQGGYDGSDMRVWFWNWWNSGLNNAFRLDHERQGGSRCGSLSVGLGGNISNSLRDTERYARRREPIPPRYLAAAEDAGNGSLMRLAPVPLRYHADPSLARARALESSLTTHPGRLAAEACGVLGHLIARALGRPPHDPTPARVWLDAERDTLLQLLDSRYPAALSGGEMGGMQCGRDGGKAREEVRRMLLAEEDSGSLELCWNWRGASLEIEKTLRLRGARYNGYPVISDYFGAFSLDGLAMALHAFYTTDSFDAAIIKVINMAGDADSTGSICGQLAGAFYGVNSINPYWRKDVHQWDERDIDLRAVALWVKGCKPDPDPLPLPPVPA